MRLNSIIYENCVVKSGARIGGMGFGFAQDSKTKINHHGNVIIKKYSTIGSNTTIDRAVFDSTIIGNFSQEYNSDGSKLRSLVNDFYLCKEKYKITENAPYRKTKRCKISSRYCRRS